MPRKKKSNLERKPSLMFAESPVHIQNNVPSPVFCARHPPTANTVPIEDLDALAWVSPQFQQLGHSGIKTRRMQRQRRHSLATHGHAAALSTTKDGAQQNGSHKTMRKYNSLKFLGERSVIPSLLEDVDITVDSETASETEIGNAGLDINEDNSPCLNRNQRKHLLVKDKNNTGNELNRSLTSVKNYSEVITENCNYSTKNVHHEIAGKNTVTKPPIKRLFASDINKLLEADTSGDDSFDNNGPCTIESEVDYGDMKGIYKNLPLLEEIPETSEEEKENQISRTRRSTRVRHLRSMLIMDEASQQAAKILAPDTPECEYGLSKRQRQLAQLRSKRH